MLLVVAGCYFDLTERRIPNWVTAAGFSVALIVRASGGAAFFFAGISTAAVVLLLLLPFFALGGFGGGDVKFLVAVSAYLAPVQVVETLLYGSLAGAAIALAIAVRRGAIIPLFLDAGQLTLSLVTFGRFGQRRTLETAGASYTAIPYGVAIGIGALAAWFT